MSIERCSSAIASWGAVLSSGVQDTSWCNHFDE